MNAKHDRDIQIEKELTRLATTLESLESKIDDMSTHMRSCLTNKGEAHAEMWREIHSHGRSISWIKGIGTGLQLIWAAIMAWMEFK